MTNKDLANLIFPNITKTIEDYEKEYPERNLPEGAKVTRFAPSPTGFVHIGNLFQALTDYFLAKNSNGIFYLRNEDTDSKREIADAVEKIFEVLEYTDLLPDEYEHNGEIVGNYGPYIQSERKEIYHAFIKYLIEIGRAYPCFCTKETLDEMRTNQEAAKARLGYYGRYARCRNLTIEEAAEKIKNGEEYVIRFKSMGNFNNKVRFNDLVSGTIEFPENDLDQIIMKSSDFLPTYHFAHVVDDHLMRTTHVVRGGEWLSSVPLHIEMFNAFGFKQPDYIHNALLLKQDGDVRRKISKRKDPEALMTYYIEKGYPKEAVIESLMTILNSNYEEWRDKNPDASYLDFNFDPKKISVSGALYDLDKLDNISKNIISRMNKDILFDKLDQYTKIYDPEFNQLINEDVSYTKNILNIEREQKKPRKDYATFSDVRKNIWYMYSPLFKDFTYEWQKITDMDEIKLIVNTYFNELYDINDDKDTWFSKVKELCNKLDYCTDMKAYKENPDNYKGSVADVSTVIRVAMTSKSNTPDLYEILKLLGNENIKQRINML